MPATEPVPLGPRGTGRAWLELERLECEWGAPVLATLVLQGGSVAHRITGGVEAYLTRTDRRTTFPHVLDTQKLVRRGHIIQPEESVRCSFQARLPPAAPFSGP